MPDIPANQQELLLTERNFHAADQIMELSAVNIDQLHGLVLLTAEIKVPRAFLIEKGTEPVQP